jgi:hypothetical protein
MRKQLLRSKLLPPAVLVLLTLAMVHPANADGPAVKARAPSVVDASVPLIARQANAMPVTGTQAGTPVPTPPTSRAAITIRPIGTAPVIVCTTCMLRASILAPDLYDLQASASAVTVKWYDTSDNELGFKVYRRDLAGNWQVVYQVPTRDMAGGGDYTWVDTSTNLSGQCYMVAAYNASASANTGEQCRVRPDPSRFPQDVSGYATQWGGLSNTNDGTGQLINSSGGFRNLLYGDQTWGVDLVYGDSSLWRVEAQGAQHYYLMKGQAVAIRVWGGGWLKYGNQTWGVDLQLSDTPVYEWYAIGQHGDTSERTWAGYPLKSGGFALWNSSAHAYLVYGHQTWGVDLQWYKDSSGSSPTPTSTPQRGVKTERVLNCSVQRDAVEVFIADQTAGSGFVDEGTLNPQYGPEGEGCPAAGSVPITFSPLSGHHYLLVATDSSLLGCGGNNDPQESACQKMRAQFVGDTNGFTRTDLVDDGTQITP